MGLALGVMPPCDYMEVDSVGVMLTLPASLKALDSVGMYGGGIPYVGLGLVPSWFRSRSIWSSNQLQLEDLWELGLIQCAVRSILLALGSCSAGGCAQSAGVGSLASSLASVNGITNDQACCFHTPHVHLLLTLMPLSTSEHLNLFFILFFSCQSALPGCIISSSLVSSPTSVHLKNCQCLLRGSVL